jgi:SSS family transporter
LFSLSTIDWIVLASYLGAVLAVGFWLGRGQRVAADFFLGGRCMPWWTVLLSIVATETSTVTFLSIPGITYGTGGDLRFMQLALGYIVGRVLVVFLLLPSYFSGEIYTAYEVLGQRIGGVTRRMASLVFIVTRTVADGLRLFLTALVLRTVLGFDLPACVAIIGIATILYTVLGGVRSVIWNDCVQFAVYMTGGLIVAAVIVNKLPGGIEQALEFARQQDKLRLLDFSPSLTSPTVTFWSGLIGGAFLSFGTHGVDQLMVQRYLAAGSRAAASRAVLASGFVVALQFVLFLLIGIGLAAFYATFPPEAALRGDEVLIRFVVDNVAIGVVGLIVAAILAAAMSTLSSSLNSSATALVNDWLVRGENAAAQPERALWMGRTATVLFGVLQMAVAIGADHYVQNRLVVDQVLAVAGLTTGLILGLYLLIVLLRRVSQLAALIGFTAGLLAVTAAFVTPISYPWYSVIGSLTTLLVGALVNYFVVGDSPGDAQLETPA